MNAEITNNTAYNITLVDGTLVKYYATVTVKIEGPIMLDQIKNLAKKSLITVNYF